MVSNTHAINLSARQIVSSKRTKFLKINSIQTEPSTENIHCKTFVVKGEVRIGLNHHRYKPNGG